MLSYYSDWPVLLPLDGCENPWGNKVVCMVGMSERRGGERRGGGAGWEFRWVQLHTTKGKEKSLSYLCCLTWGHWDFPHHNSFIGSQKADPPLPVGGTTIQLHRRTQRSTGNWPHKGLNHVTLSFSSHKDGHSSAACQAHGHNTSVMLKHANSGTATSRSAAPSWNLLLLINWWQCNCQTG